MSIRQIQDRMNEYLRHLGFGELRAPDPLDADPSSIEDMGGFKLPKHFNQVQQDARDFEQLAKQPGWPKLLDALERTADVALKSLRDCASSDAQVIKGFRDRWAEAESRLRIIQTIISDKVAERDAMLADLAQRYGMDSADDVISEVKIVNQMKNQLKRDGFVAVTPDEVYSEETQPYG